MADLNYNVPEEIAAAFKEFCEDEGLTQRVAIQWALFNLMEMDLAERRKLIDSYKFWVKEGDPPKDESSGKAKGQDAVQSPDKTKTMM